MSKSLVSLRLRNSFVSVAKVYKRPSYILLAVVGVFFASGLILWSLNLGLVGYILFQAPLTIGGKINFFLDIYKEIYTTYTSIQGTGIVIFSFLFGINLGVLVYVLKHKGFQAIPKKSGVGGLMFAVLGGGCIACGTSLIAPLLATLGATTAPFVRDLATIFNLIGSLLLLYSIYKLGEIVSIIFAKEKLENNREAVR
jgi:hypothetical protein